MYEDVKMTAGPGARFVQQTGAGGPKAFDGGVEIGYTQGDVVQAGAALFEKSGDGGIGWCGDGVPHQRGLDQART